MMMTPVVSMSPSPGQAVVSSTPSQDDTNRNAPIIAVVGVLVSLLTIVTATIIAISVLLWLRKRKREAELVDSAAYIYLSQNKELDSNPAYHTVNAANVVKDSNESYTANSVPTLTSSDTAYQTVQTPSRRSLDIATSANKSYVATDITTSANAAYHPIDSSNDDTQQLEYDYVRYDNDLDVDTAYQTVQPPSRKSVDIATSANESYVTTDITASANAAYHPIDSSNDDTQPLEYEYVRSEDRD